MSFGLGITIAWIFVISIIGMSPMRFHRRFALPMLALFPIVLGLLAWELGIWWALALFVGGLSIFRYPARYYGLILWRKLRGQEPAE
ncbi:MAG: hypothetical protein ACI861_000714 [Paracoccaceae bacterium]|jgi:hypothetical protein